MVSNLLQATEIVGGQSWALSHVLSPGSHGAGRTAQELDHKSQS